MDIVNLKLPDYYINRELSALEFSRRVLHQAKDPAVPLLERLKFLCIVSANLDEFFEIRVSGLQQRAEIAGAAGGAAG
ncbi:MAG: RNA degradosome polyphosphate kinase, partial [Gammaproteobacteria bacterium]|nr:RNA degradosome polyphosphate kinase [Gammaproteobacteria bacterium]